MPTDEKSVIVLGAGVMGLCAALYLQRSGQKVRVLDPLPPAGGTSYGNAGLISSDTVVPIALPGMLKKVPKWLMDPEGPLSIKPKYLPHVTPWLLRWVGASRMQRVLKISDAMHALHHDSMKCWRDLLGEKHFSELIRPSGQVRVWDGEAIGSKVEIELSKRYDIPVEILDANRLQEMYPGISKTAKGGLLVPGNGYTVNPQRLVQTLGDLFMQEGGEIIAERVLEVVKEGTGQGFRLITNISNKTTPTLVVATGAWSRYLLDPLGISVPLESERGYHAMMPTPNITLPIPISVKSRGFGLTSMEGGLRAAGTVELAGLTAPPSLRRAEILVEHAKRLFPALQSGEPAYWMGHRPSMPDSLPVLGKVPKMPGLYLAFGHGHFGMTGSPPSARLLSELINDKPPTIDPSPYSCTRFS